MPASFIPAFASATSTDQSSSTGTLGFEPRGRLNFESAYNVYLGLPGGGDVLELTVNVGREEPYDLGEGYNHMALVVADLDALLQPLAEHGIKPEKPPYGWARPSRRDEYRICFVTDPDGYRIELIDGAFPTPQDPPHPSRPASHRRFPRLRGEPWTHPHEGLDSIAHAQSVAGHRRGHRSGAACAGAEAAWERFVGGREHSRRGGLSRCVRRSRTRGAARPRPALTLRPPGRPGRGRRR